MSNPTTPFNWQMPTNTDLVTDLPADFEVFGQAVATSMADLLGGTSGQILSKNSNTDMDFVWINNDQGDITGITATSPLTGGGTSGAITVGIQTASTTQSGAVQLTDSTSSTSTTTAATPNAVKTSYDLAAAAIPKSTVTTAGDVIYATGSSAVTRLGIGSTGQVLTVAGGVPTWATASGSSGPAFLAYNNANQTVTAGAWTKLSLNSEVFDTDGCFASSRFTPTKAGYYVTEITVTTNGTCYGVIYKNGAAYKYLCNSNADIYASGGIVLYMNGTTDYLEVYVKSSTTTVYGGSSLECTFSGAWIRS